MAQTQHTPGPWSLEKGNLFTVVHDDGDDFPWFITTAHIGFAPGVAEANARLIAAAPDLLEALKRLTADVKIAGLHEKAGWDCFVSMADAAIAKAEGRTDA